MKYFEPTVQPLKPVGVYHGEDGLNINWDDSLKSGAASGEQAIVKHLEYLTKNGVQSRDICILFRDANKQTLDLNLGVEIQNAEELWTNPENNKVVVDSIRRFKGLQSKVVILYDPPNKGALVHRIFELLLLLDCGKHGTWMSRPSVFGRSYRKLINININRFKIFVSQSSCFNRR